MLQLLAEQREQVADLGDALAARDLGGTCMLPAALSPCHLVTGVCFRRVRTLHSFICPKLQFRKQPLQR